MQDCNERHSVQLLFTNHIIIGKTKQSYCCEGFEVPDAASADSLVPDKRSQNVARLSYRK